jgi:hypothetical protein
MNRLQKTTDQNRPLPIDSFVPDSPEDSRLLDIAQHVGEQDLRFLLSIRDRYGLSVIESAWIEFRDAEADRRPINHKSRFFNYLIQQHLRRLYAGESPPQRT